MVWSDDRSGRGRKVHATRRVPLGRAGIDSQVRQSASEVCASHRVRQKCVRVRQSAPGASGASRSTSECVRCIRCVRVRQIASDRVGQSAP
eukprot:4679719-Prymnesium_polylepis.1